MESYSVVSLCHVHFIWMQIFFVCLWATPAYAQGWLMTLLRDCSQQLRGLYVALGLEAGSAACRTGALPARLFLQPHVVFIHSSITGYLGCSHVLAVVNSTVVSIGVHVVKIFLKIDLYFLCICVHCYDSFFIYFCSQKYSTMYAQIHSHIDSFIKE